MRVVFKDLFLTAQKTHCLFITKSNRLVLFREITVVIARDRECHKHCVQNVASCFVKTGGMYAYHSDFWFEGLT